MKYHSFDEAIKDLFGAKTTVISETSVSGGDINRARRIELSSGDCIFVKSNQNKKIEFYEDEVNGLCSIASTGTIRTPKTFAIGKDDSCGIFLIMEFVKSVPRQEGFWEMFARELAAMHRASTGKYVEGRTYGFLKNNYIGSRQQMNEPNDSWIDFFRSCRLQPRFLDAKEYFDIKTKKQISYFLDHLDKWLIEPAYPSLLHGDLWGGNFIVGNDGKAWLIDPAVYVGHAEADIAMTELFGGFSELFYSEYMKSGGVDAGYEDRRDIYNLYHLLNHLISFGRSYYGSVCRILDRFCG